MGAKLTRMTALVLHIDTEKGWRGGQRQEELLLTGLKEQGIPCELLARSGSEAASRLRPLVGKVLELSQPRGWPWSPWRLASYCRQHDVGIMHAHSSGAHSLGLAIKRWHPDLKLIVHRRVDNRPGQGFWARRKYLNPAVDAYIAISEAVRDVLLETGVTPDKISLVRSAVPLGRASAFDHREEKHKLATSLGVDVQLPLIGIAAAMTAQKGYETLLQALAELKRRGVKFHAVFAGDGELYDDLLKLRAELQLAHDVSMLGHIQEVTRFLSALDIFASPSRNEGLGTVILEAIDAGLPVVASRVGGIPEIIRHQDTGILVEPDHPVALAEALAMFIEQPEFAQKLAARARQHVEASFSVEAMIRGCVLVYGRLGYPV